MIPDLNQHGNLPEGIHKPSIPEFKQKYVLNFKKSASRKDIFARYTHYCNKMIQYDVADLQWLDGSYTTKKENPGDIDFVTHVDAIKVNSLKNDSDFVSLLNHGEVKENYRCDTYFIFVYPKEDPRYSHTLAGKEYWIKWFGHDREMNPKGLIQFDLSSQDHQSKIMEEAYASETS
ncbi:DUF6932 family protein [Methanofollis sp. UBA420]|jgi:hypothetical protein|uniref:DUF6932 family protein n=1 Tax=Methanofollis sp. UBA420 TaxID=1915514 RepID=UPI00316AD56D